MQKKSKPDDAMDIALTTGQGYFVPPSTMDAYLSKKYKTKTSQQDGAEETDDIVGWLLLLTA